ncbi:unnamed protein product [Cylindrotheca closterium]|uniref:B30.2/SPRY domain-containing protein n=1 Tax=Cylindrotheca closterium TaxID=2856 RepID=A0AAD2JMV9_9STRA|nr:unnamed protein product [Cylindrotheca closterium]
MTEQLIVRFRDKSVVIPFPDASSFINEEERNKSLVSLWSSRCGWPRERLFVASWQLPFVQISVVSAIRGGKGGFGTLLKGQSRQAGAKLTTDFGACRDLQGRRLRHVNDEIKLRKWREMEKRKQAGEEVPDDELWKTPSGLYNWHLMTPTWANVSKKATNRIKRQFQKLNQEALKEAEMKKERDDLYQKSMTLYLDKATRETETLQEEIPDAIKQGLKARNAKKRKYAEEPLVIDQNPSALCTLSGDMVLVENEEKGSAQIQSKSEFATAVFVLDQLPAEGAQLIYYEVTLVSGGLAQIGWACLVGEQRFFPNSDLGNGVGDDVSSYGIDGSRSLKFHGGSEDKCDIQWKAGDRLGTFFNSKNKSIWFAVNGSKPKKVFQLSEDMKDTLVPALSCNLGQVLELHTGRQDCKFFPDGPVASAEEMIAKEDKMQLKPPEAKGQNKSSAKQAQQKTKMPDEKVEIKTKKKSIQPERLDLRPFQTATDLEALGLDRLKSALMALQVKCGGTLKERAARLFLLKSLPRKEYPKKVRTKDFIE